MTNQPDYKDPLQTKFYILRSESDRGVCLIVEARNIKEARERANKLADVSDDFQLLQPESVQ
jgi:hypothetical protein